MTGLRPDTLGVLGGMGPLATADFMRKLIELTPARSEAEHIPLILLSAPDIPDRVGPIMTGKGPSPLPVLLARRRLLEQSGARAIAMPCNTAHHWERELIEGCSIPFISIVDASMSAISKAVAKGVAVGLVATAATLKSGFFQRRLETEGYRPMLPEATVQSEAILPGIALVKKNRLAEAEPLFKRALDDLLGRGAETILLACTEVDMAVGRTDAALRRRCIDTNEALAAACVKWALAQRRNAA